MKRNRFKNRAYNVNQQPYSAFGAEQRRSNGGSTDERRNLSNRISPVQLQRLRQDIGSWREAMNEAESAWFPHRIKMHRLYIDTVLNGHVTGCMERRKDLTLLRGFTLKQGKDELPEDHDLLKMFRREWFDLVVNYALDALAYGYSLVSLGDIVQDNFVNASLVRRWHISPDRLNVTAFTYTLSGANFLEEPYADWHIWVPTVNENGVGSCGYGYLYRVALYEIFLRNTLGFNGDFIELFAMPYRVAKTTKTEEGERKLVEEAVQSMGAAGWAVLDPLDEIEFLEAGNAGTGYTAYESMEERCQKVISKIILGHADAMDSVPGKLGSGQGEDNSPVAKALKAKQTKDGIFIERIVNEQLLPKMRNLGFRIPEGIEWKLKNDEEREAFRAREDASNKVTAEIAQTMKNAGLKMDAKYFTDRTGIVAEEVEEPAPVSPEEARQVEKIKNQLNDIYSL